MSGQTTEGAGTLHTTVEPDHQQKPGSSGNDLHALSDEPGVEIGPIDASSVISPRLSSKGTEPHQGSKALNPLQEQLPEPAEPDNAGGGRGPVPPGDRGIGGAEMPEGDDPEGRAARIVARMQRMLQFPKGVRLTRELGFSKISVVRPEDVPDEVAHPEPGTEGQRVTGELYTIAKQLKGYFGQFDVVTGDLVPGQNLIATGGARGERKLYVVNTGHFTPSPDLRELIPAAQAGDPKAQRILEDLIEAGIKRALGEKGPDDTLYDDRRQNVQARLDRHPFDPFSRPIPEGTDPERIPQIIQERFHGYIRRVAMSVVDAQEQPSRAAQLQILPDTVGPLGEFAPPRTNQGKYENGDITDRFRYSELARILTPRELDIVLQRAEGRTNQEIAAHFGINPRTVNERVSDARQKIEQNLLTPKGIKRISDFPDKRQLWELAERGEIPAIKVVGRWYIHGNWLPLPLSPTLHKLADIATGREMIRFLNEHPDKVGLFRRAMYLDEKDMHLLDRIKETMPPREPIPPPAPGLIAAVDLAKTKSEEGALHVARRAQRFSRSQQRGREHFIPKDEATRYLEQWRQRRSAKKRQ